MLADMFKPSQEPVRILTGLKMIIADGSLPVDKSQSASLLELLDNVINLINQEREVKVAQSPNTIVPGLDFVLDLLSTQTRLSASNRKEIVSVLKEARHEVELVVSENKALKTNHVKIDDEAVIKALRAQVGELTALVELQSSYIHNNHIKKTPAKPATIPFLSEEQRDAVFGVYSVNPDWLKNKFGDKTVTTGQVEELVRAEANILGQKQLGHNHFQIYVNVTSPLAVRFSLRQNGAFQGVNRLMGNNLFPGVLNGVTLAEIFGAMPNQPKPNLY